MYKQDKVGVDVRIDGMLGELSYDIERAKKHVEACKKAYEEAHELATKAVIALVMPILSFTLPSAISKIWRVSISSSVRHGPT